MSNKKTKNGGSGNQTWLLVGTVIFLGVVTWYSIRPDGGGGIGNTMASMEIATLSPDLFGGKTREAYAAARDIPEVLAELQCYCGCAQTEGHDNNLFCYIDNHAAG